MQTTMTTPTNESTQELLPWHAPDIQKLIIALDTSSSGPGSGATIVMDMAEPLDLLA